MNTTLLQRFVEYAQAFEKTYVDDDWTRLEPYFAPDAVYRVVGSTSWDCCHIGPDASRSWCARFGWAA